MKYALIIIALLISLLSFGQPTSAYKTKNAPLPPFVLERVKGPNITNKTLQKGKPVLLMIFSPQCDHCERTIDSLKHMQDQLAKWQLLLVTEERNRDQLPSFFKKSGLDTMKAFKNLGMDRSNLIPYIYTFQMLPQFNIYNSQHKLVKSFAGMFPLDSLRMYLK